MSTTRKFKWVLGVALTAATALPCGSAIGQTVTTDDPLHAFCYGTSACADNGTVTPTTTNPPQFGFTVSPGSQTGHYLIDVLVPNNEPQPTSYTISATQAGPLDRSSVSATSTQLGGQWTGGNLSTFLGINASPTNPISAWLPYTQANDDPTASGYFVYQVNLGWTLLQPPSKALAGPLLNINGPLDPGTVITGFLNTGTPSSPNWIATAPSGGLYIHKVPEPGTLSLMALALAALGFAARLRVAPGFARKSRK